MFFLISFSPAPLIMVKGAGEESERRVKGGGKGKGGSHLQAR